MYQYPWVSAIATTTRSTSGASLAWPDRYFFYRAFIACTGAYTASDKRPVKKIAVWPRETNLVLARVFDIMMKALVIHVIFLLITGLVFPDNKGLIIIFYTYLAYFNI